MWKKIVRLHRKIAPEMIATVEERYTILRSIKHAEPVGRRALASILDKGERIVRAQVDFLKTAGLVDISPMGMTITPEGETVLNELSEYVRVLHGLTSLEEKIMEQLGLKRVIIIPGDSDADETVKRELGRAASGILAQYLQDNMTVAVSGGSLMAMVSESINFTRPSTVVVPARGGLGERVEYQANTIAAVMAGKLGGKYRLLHVPDNISEEMAGILIQSNNVTAVTDLIKTSNILMHGIGQAKEMAVRRGFDEQFVATLLESGAVGEVLGHYYTLQGKSIYITSSLGLNLEDLASIGMVIAVAGGRNKAEAIVAVTSAGWQDILITDESCAKAIQELHCH
jgi:central glycolytic genes regulator